MRLEKIAWLTTAVCVMATVSYLITRAWAQAGRPHISFTRVEVEKIMGPSDVPISERRMVKAVRSDGALAETTLSPDGHYQGRNVTLPNERKTVSVDDALKSVTTTYMTEETAARLRRYYGDARCTNSRMSYIGEETILGYRTYKYAFTQSSSDGETFVAVHWFAPDLECIALKETLNWNSNGQTGKTLHDITNVTVADPDTNLFDIPADYTEMSPLQVASKRAAMRHTSLSPRMLEQTLMRDQRYIESRKNKP